MSVDFSALKSAPVNLLTPGHPMLASAESAPEEMVADWLTDQGCGLGDVLRLYAGTGPGYTDGLPWGVLALWLRQNGHDDAGREVRGEALAADLAGPVTDGPFAAVVRNLGLFHWRGWVPEEHRGASVVVRRCSCSDRPPSVALFGLASGPGDLPARKVWRGDCPDCSAAKWACTREPIDVRNAKRRVLALFHGVLCAVTLRSAVLRRDDYLALVDRDGPSAPANLRTESVTFTLDGGVKVRAGRDRPVRLGRDGDWHLVTRWVPAQELVPPERHPPL